MTAAKKPNRREKRSWDKYVTEAKKTYSEIDLGDEVLIVHIPTSSQMESLANISDTDQWGQIYALLGDENGAKLRAVAGDAPVTALRELMKDVSTDLGLSDDLGE